MLAFSLRASSLSRSFCTRPPPLTTASWSLRSLQATDPGAAPLTDADVLHVASLSHLRLAPGSAELSRAKRAMEGVLASTRAVRRVVEAAVAARGAAADAVSAEGITPAASAAPSAEQDPFAHLTPEQFEALAEARFAELRADAVTEGGDAVAALRHAARTQGDYFSVPRVVGEG